jgi:hypothetical protein
MAKVGRTKTHVKIYLTPNEVDALVSLMVEGLAGFEVSTPEGPTPAMLRVDATVGKALRLAEEIKH